VVEKLPCTLVVSFRMRGLSFFFNRSLNSRVPVDVRVVSGSTPWWAMMVLLFEGSVFGQARGVR
jgi:hypothetical protein